jgi:hypothetical protein
MDGGKQINKYLVNYHYYIAPSIESYAGGERLREVVGKRGQIVASAICCYFIRWMNL